MNIRTNTRFALVLALSLTSHLHAIAAEQAGASDPKTEASAELTEMLAPCAECHGLNGASLKPEVPHLDRQEIAYLVESLDLLAKGMRKSLVQPHVPADWSGKDFRAVAGFYNRARPVREVETHDPEKARIGREWFMERCESCHEDSGREPDYRGAGSAILAGQRVTYLIGQLRDYVNGQRKILVSNKREHFFGLPISVNGKTVGERLEKLGDPEIEAIAHFLASTPIQQAKLSGRRARRGQ